MERIQDPEDSLRFKLQAAKSWGVPPTVILKERTVNTTEYTARDVDFILAFEVYEDSLCPGGPHVLAETSKPEHAGAYRPAGEEDQIVCHRCKAQALLSDHMAEKEGTAGVFVPLVLDEEIVARNKLPVPPRPPELVQQPEVDAP